MNGACDRTRQELEQTVGNYDCTCGYCRRPAEDHRTEGRWWEYRKTDGTWQRIWIPEEDT